MSRSNTIKIAILGLSADPDRYAYKAAERLIGQGFSQIWGVHPKAQPVLGLPVVKTLGELPEDIHTITVYVGPSVLESMGDAILALRPKRIILNPGTESEVFSQKAQQQAVEVLEECTLVMLSLKRF